MITELAFPITILILIAGLLYYRLFIYDKWEAANTKIAKHELDSIPWVSYDRRKTTIFEPVK